MEDRVVRLEKKNAQSCNHIETLWSDITMFMQMFFNNEISDYKKKEKDKDF